jgi:tetratricopeptide (TPR) repeat protein
VPECAADLQKQIDPVYENARLLKALERKGEDPTARGPWALAILQRELAASVGPTAVTPEGTPDARAAEVAKAIAGLEALVTADPSRYGGSRGLLGLAYVLQKDDERGLTLLASLLDSDDVPDADHLYLLATSMTTTRDTQQGQEKLAEAMAAAADRLNPIIADGQPHPRARYARYSLLAWAGQLDKALEETRALTASGSTDAPAWAALGFFEGQKGNYDAGEQALVRATELDPGDLHAAYALGLVRWAKAGDGVPSLPLLRRLEDDSPVDRSARTLGF